MWHQTSYHRRVFEEERTDQLHLALTSCFANWKTPLTELRVHLNLVPSFIGSHFGAFILGLTGRSRKGIDAMLKVVGPGFVGLEILECLTSAHRADDAGLRHLFPFYLSWRTDARGNKTQYCYLDISDNLHLRRWRWSMHHDLYPHLDGVFVTFPGRSALRCIPASKPPFFLS